MGSALGINYLSHIRISKACMLDFFMREGGSKCQYKRAIVGPPAKRHFNGVSLAAILMAFCWRTDNGPTLDSGYIAL